MSSRTSSPVRVVLPALLAATMLTGCAHRVVPVSSPNLTVLADNTSLPAPKRSDLTAGDRPSLIGPLDTISVNVFNVPELSQEMQVDASGRISMPLIGTIDARGKTSQELAALIRASLTGLVRNPDVTINIKSSVSQVVTIDGQVTEPGLYPVTNQMTLMRVIASAKGMTEFAKQDDVVILRTVDNKRMAGLYNITAIRNGAYEDPPIYANDIIIVGDSPARRLFKDVLATAPLFVAPIVAMIEYVKF